MITKLISWNCKYKVKSKQIDLAAEQLQSKIKSMLLSDDFIDNMFIINNEVSSSIEKIEDNTVEFLVLIFVTMQQIEEPPNKLFRKWMESNLIKIDDEYYSARLIKRRIY